MKSDVIKVVVVLTTSLSFVSTADGMCGSEVPDQITSIPSDGSSSIPLLSNLFVIATDKPSAVRFNGFEASGKGGRWTPATLQPNQTYLVEIDFISSFDGTKTFELEMTTGDLPSEPNPPAPNVLRATRITDIPAAGISQTCVRNASHTCFDTSIPIIVQFEVEGDAPAYLISSDLGDLSVSHRKCGSPIWRGMSDNGCFEIAAISENGFISESSSICLDESEPSVWNETSNGTTNGCATSDSPVHVWMLFIVFACIRRKARTPRPPVGSSNQANRWTPLTGFDNVAS